MEDVVLIAVNIVGSPLPREFWGHKIKKYQMKVKILCGRKVKPEATRYTYRNVLLQVV